MADEHGAPRAPSGRSGSDPDHLRRAVEDLRAARAEDRGRIAAAVRELRDLVRANAETIGDVAEQVATMRADADTDAGGDAELAGRVEDLERRVAEAAVRNDLTNVRQAMAELSVEVREGGGRLAEVTDAVQTLADRQRGDRGRADSRLGAVADALDHQREATVAMRHELDRIASLAGTAREDAAAVTAELTAVRDDLVELVKRSAAANDADLAELRHRMGDHARVIDSVTGRVDRHAEQIAKLAGALSNAVGRVEFQAVAERVGGIETLVEARVRDVETAGRQRLEALEEAQQSDRAELLSATVRSGELARQLSELAERTDQGRGRRDRELGRLEDHDAHLADLARRLRDLEVVLDGVSTAETSVEQRALEMHLKVESLASQLAALPTLTARLDRLERRLGDA